MRVVKEVPKTQCIVETAAPCDVCQMLGFVNNLRDNMNRFATSISLITQANIICDIAVYSASLTQKVVHGKARTTRKETYLFTKACSSTTFGLRVRAWQCPIAGSVALARRKIYNSRYHTTFSPKCSTAKGFGEKTVYFSKSIDGQTKPDSVWWTNTQIHGVVQLNGTLQSWRTERMTWNSGSDNLFNFKIHKFIYSNNFIIYHKESSTCKI